MTKGTKIFRITICVLLALTVLWSVFFGLGFFAFARYMILTNEYGVWVSGVSVTRDNKSDVLGDGTVSYLPDSNTLVLNNANIQADYAAVLSKIDLKIMLIGENKFICKDGEYISAIYAADTYLYKDISIEGDGSLEIAFENVSKDAQGIFASNIQIMADVTIDMPDCSNIVNGIVCDSSLMLMNQASLTLNNGSAAYSSGIRVRGNTFLHSGCSINLTTNPGTVEECKGLSINGDLILAEGSAVNVSVDDASSANGECLRVNGMIDAGKGANVNASAKVASSIECYGAIKLNEGASVSANTEGSKKDIVCYGAVVDFGATVSGEIEALGGVHNKVGI